MENERARKLNWRIELKQKASKYNEYKENEILRKLLNKEKIQKDLKETRQGQANPVDIAKKVSRRFQRHLALSFLPDRNCIAVPQKHISIYKKKQQKTRQRSFKDWPQNIPCK